MAFSNLEGEVIVSRNLISPTSTWAPKRCAKKIWLWVRLRSKEQVIAGSIFFSETQQNPTKSGWTKTFHALFQLGLEVHTTEVHPLVGHGHPAAGLFPQVFGSIIFFHNDTQCFFFTYRHIYISFYNIFTWSSFSPYCVFVCHRFWASNISTPVFETISLPTPNCLESRRPDKFEPFPQWECRTSTSQRFSVGNDLILWNSMSCHVIYMWHPKKIS